MNAISTPMPAQAVSPKTTRRTLLLLAAVFVLPFVIGSGLFWSGWRPAKFVNRGELLQPPRELPDGGLLDTGGRPLPTAELRGKWLLIRVAGATCDAVCENDLQQMQQVHIALNKDQSRVQRVLISSGEATGDDTPSWASLRRRFPDTVLASLDPDAARRAWQGVFTGTGRQIYLVDPLGKVMMRYADPPDLRGVLKDLERLLKYSWIR
jgi:hypothetical protein